MRTLSLPKFGIRHRILLLTLLPLLFISLILGSYFTYTRFQDAELNLIERGQLLARLLASSSEFGLITNNHELLQATSKGPLLEQDVSDILFLNGRYEVIQRSAHFPIHLKIGAPSAYKQGQYWYFTQPVVTTGIPFLDNPEFQDTEQIIDTIGWVVIVISETRTLKQQEQILLASGALLIIGIIITFLIAQRFGKRISHPILGLTRVMEKIQNGNLDARMSHTYTGEFSLLSQGLNDLADTVQKSITDQKTRVELATRRLQSTLHHLEQQNVALAKARRQADEANQAKDDFLARMSHELRTPLTSVVGFARLLKTTPCSDEQLEHIRIINQTALMLLSIVDDILDFSKLQRDAISLERILFSLEDIIYDVLEMQAPSAFDKHLELISHIQTISHLEVLGDPTRLRQVISNLVANAIKFTDKGTVEVHLENSILNTQQSLFTIKVIDTGIGIPQKHLDQLFQAFMQADTTITRRFGGSGLGLVITKKLTELMGGKLFMVSQEGQGTTVTLQIPLRTHTLPNQAPDEPAYLSTPILFYEENVSLRRSIANTLKKQVSTIYPAQSLEECLHLASEYQIVILSLPSKNDMHAFIFSIAEQIAQKAVELILICPNNITLPPSLQKVTSVNKPLRPNSLYHALRLGHTPIYTLSEESDDSLEDIQIVVAEDNKFNQLLIHTVLNNLNIRVFTAETGLQAIELVEKHRPNCVIMDVHMPVMDGLEATKRIKSIYPDLPVIALTANIIEHEHLALLNAGISSVLLKPINEAELINTIKSLTSFSSIPLQDLSSSENQRLSLEKYNIPETWLHNEMKLLTNKLVEAVKTLDIRGIREINHQLSGLAGLYELPEVECCTIEIHDILSKSEQDWNALWKQAWRLSRLVKGLYEGAISE